MPTQLQNAPNALRDQALIWLRESKWEIEEMTLRDGYRWLFAAVRKPGLYVVFAQPDGMPDGLVIQCQMPLSEECRHRLLQRSTEAQEQFLWDLETLLIAAGAEYSFDAPVPTSVYLTESVFCGDGGLSKDRFMEGIRRVGIGMRAVHISLRRLLGRLLDVDPSVN